MTCKIFVPITGSNESKIATDKAVETAAMLNAKIVAVNVLDKDSLAKLQRYKIFQITFTDVLICPCFSHNEDSLFSVFVPPL